MYLKIWFFVRCFRVWQSVCHPRYLRFHMTDWSFKAICINSKNSGMTTRSPSLARHHTGILAWRLQLRLYLALISVHVPSRTYCWLRNWSLWIQLLMLECLTYSQIQISHKYSLFVVGGHEARSGCYVTAWTSRRPSAPTYQESQMLYGRPKSRKMVRLFTL